MLGSAVDTWATVAVAIGTIGAVAYALFRDLFVAPRRRPKLELRFDRAGNDQIIVGTPGGGEAAHVRLRVVNEAGRDTADDVVVVVTELRHREETTPIGLPLTWSGTSPPLTMSSVHPGSERHIDLLHLESTDSVPLQLDVNPKPKDDRAVLNPGTYEVAVEIRARNADAVRYSIPIEWEGKWDHLRVEAPRRVR